MNLGLFYIKTILVNLDDLVPEGIGRLVGLGLSRLEPGECWQL